MTAPTAPDLPLHAHLPSASRLVFGCMGLGGGWTTTPFDEDDVRAAHAAVDAALEAGITVFDHADIYTFGKAESVFGRMLAERPDLRASILLQSKCGIRFADDAGPKRYDASASWITHSVDGTLARLGIERLDALLLHRPDPLMEPAEIAEAFTALRASGKVDHFGVSNMSGAQMQWLQAALDAPLVANQIELGLGALAWLEEGVTVGQGAAAEVGFTAGTLEYCRASGVQLQAWGPLSQGRFSRAPEDAAPAERSTASVVAEMAGRYAVPPEAIVLAFLLRHPARIQPVLGTTDPARIAACARALEIELAREDWYALYEVARGGELP